MDTKYTYSFVLKKNDYTLYNKDEKSEIFNLFAEKKAGVTRNIIIDKEGNIAFLTRLFEKQEFDEMKNVIEKLIKK